MKIEKKKKETSFFLSSWYLYIHNLSQANINYFPKFYLLFFGKIIFEEVRFYKEMKRIDKEYIERKVC